MIGCHGNCQIVYIRFSCLYKLITRYISAGMINTFLSVYRSVVRGTPKIIWIIGSASLTLCLTMGLRKYFSSLAKCRRSMEPKIVLVENAVQWDVIESEFLEAARKEMVLGFDCEWVTRKGYIGRVALLQLAVTNGLTVVARLNKLQGLIPEELKNLLADGKILKVGVAPHMDSKKLMKDYGFLVKGYLDLGWLAASLPKRNPLLQRYGLRHLAKEILSVDLDKSFGVRCSDWEAATLTEEQLAYAAKDALVAVGVFRVLTNAHLSIKGRILKAASCHWTVVLPQIRDWQDRPFKHNMQQMKSKVPSKSTGSQMTPDRPYSRSQAVRKSPLYHNCVLEAPDGQPLCTCDVKKVQWYLEKDLAEEISTEPRIVRLKFEPSRRPTADEKFYLLKKINRCVVCGVEDSYIRKNVVPHEYRRHFPSIMKDHKSHDIVLLCVNCHRSSNLSDLNLRRQLAEECGAPMGPENSRLLEDPQMKKIKSAAKALLLNGLSIPLERKLELENVLLSHFGKAEVTEQLLHEAMNLEIKLENDQYLSHGLTVVQKMSTTKGLLALESLWREHFLNTMQARFLPSLWSVDHGHESIRAKLNGETTEMLTLFGTQDQ